ncbi:LytR C-terminal domain-containing protein [Microcella sp.]|uniref:LytR C-terminal domain-containing protein n=1 Tax=Microcella sp. TaxID=1913979 RepID=UPI00256E6637|nr:LytR C-terminal domain-containing protein [Microcella sp.]MBX9471722.1 LytR C-terminal domain-containing protein [Microcella sp.]
MAEFAPDRFDEIPAELGRVGAHRAPRRRGRVVIAIAWAALASGVLVVAGLWGLSLITDRVTFEIPGFDTAEPMPTPTESASPTPPSVEPITDPALAELPAGFTITILNGAGVDGLGATARDLLTAPGWPVGTVTSAGQDDLTETVVFYSDPALEGVALGMAVLLGTGDIELSDAFPGAPITITLGADFAELAP